MEDPQIQPTRVDDQIRFPPWPSTPPNLISYSNFRPLGLVPLPDEGAASDSDPDSDSEAEFSDEDAVEKAGKKTGPRVERDGAGIETIHLDVNHDPARHRNKDSKRSRGRKATKDGVLRVDDIEGRKAEDGTFVEPMETRGGEPYDSSLHPVTRLYRAAKEWEISRKFALDRTYLSIWKHFKDFAQLNEPKQDDTETHPPLDDDDDEDGLEAELEIDEDGFVSFAPDEDDPDDECGSPCRFGKDIERAVRVWLSSESREQGLGWLDHQLLGVPTLTASFLRYLLAHGVLPEPHFQAALQTSLEICEQAKAQTLDNATFQMALNDGFNKICSRAWGREHETELARARWQARIQAEEAGAAAAAASADHDKSILSSALPSPASTPHATATASDLTNNEYSTTISVPSGWDLDPTDLTSTIELPPLETSLSDGDATDVEENDNGGWGGTSLALSVNPAAVLVGTNTTSSSGGVLTGTGTTKLEDWVVAGQETSLRRIVAVGVENLPFPWSRYHHHHHHPLASSSSFSDKSNLALVPILLEEWSNPPPPFDVPPPSVTSSDPLLPLRRASAGEENEDAAYDGEGRCVVWVEEGLRERVVVGSGLSGSFVRMEMRREGEVGGEGKGGDDGKGRGGFWFVDLVEMVIPSFWLSESKDPIL